MRASSTGAQPACTSCVARWSASPVRPPERPRSNARQSDQRRRRVQAIASLMPLPRFDTRHVRRRLRSGSSSPVVVESAAGLFVARLRGAGQGVLALISEITEIAERLGLAVPERALIDLRPEMR